MEDLTMEEVGETLLKRYGSLEFLRGFEEDDEPEYYELLWRCWEEIGVELYDITVEWKGGCPGNGGYGVGARKLDEFVMAEWEGELYFYRDVDEFLEYGCIYQAFTLKEDAWIDIRTKIDIEKIPWEIEADGIDVSINGRPYITEHGKLRKVSRVRDLIGRCG
ncbi:hypothetical protein [Hydrogenimonas sp. SS33]|uniref:hypothetical protein n=1 Tax=Hydrogenimonas leucolamina TaxID=2954236 RepID=UPI00336BEF09